ncbi:SxtJ family membrane protein [Candidatus Pelagibacter sp. HIMB1517]|uniref:SxtJ family membrane protein n=1 Tax=Candidatus Pelagibacter sp. HIMB1517 TaxID=3413341 RepID=UPI003F83B3FE
MKIEKQVGYLFFIIFLFFSIFFYESNIVFFYTLIISAIIFLILTIYFSKFLLPFSKLWIKLGYLLGKIVSPIIMFCIYFIVLTPTSIIMRVFNIDSLRIRKKSKTSSYWVNKKDKISSMRLQY